jgi:hypothetical protein
MVECFASSRLLSSPGILNIGTDLLSDDFQQRWARTVGSIVQDRTLPGASLPQVERVVGLERFCSGGP